MNNNKKRKDHDEHEDILENNFLPSHDEKKKKIA